MVRHGFPAEEERMDRQEREGLHADLTRIERMNIDRRRMLSLGAMVGIGGGVAALAGCASPAGWDGPGGPPPPDGRFGPPPGDLGSMGPGSMGPGSIGPGGHPGGPPPHMDNGPVVTATAPDGNRCVSFAPETQGPYPADGSNGARGAISNVLGQSGLRRQDIRGDIGGGHDVAGVPLELTLRLVDVNTGCAPLAGYAVYLWHCDPAGQYSLYDQPERSWLRGLQVADADGLVRFSTIVPGCYMGRFPHIHFEAFASLDVATAGKFARLTSQLAVPADACDAAYRQPAYTRSVRPWAQSRDIARDMVFGDNGAERLKAMTLEVTGSAREGFKGRALIGLPG
ncbi:dioxygenase-like protein [Novosphingobium sp. ST904]|nr:dioxygenase-like protein [Novosphingobium sp. ST904]